MDKFTTEHGETIRNFKIAYTCIGKPNKDLSNIIWAIHPFTADIDVKSWMPHLVGRHKVFDTSKYGIICANVPGSPYGSTCPLDINPDTRKKYYYDFPKLTPRDIIDCFEYVRVHLRISKIALLIGPSMGGQLVYQWLISYPESARHAIIIAADAQMSMWGVALHTVQKNAIMLDSSWNKRRDDAGKKGLSVARQMGVISYRSPYIFHLSQNPKALMSNPADEKSNVRSFRSISSYLQYQGDTFLARFNAFSYMTLIEMMNAHDVSRGYESIESALRRITATVLLVGIDSDVLFFTDTIKKTKRLIKHSIYKEITSVYGHDAFLIESKQMEDIIFEYFNYIGEFI